MKNYKSPEISGDFLFLKKIANVCFESAVQYAPVFTFIQVQNDDTTTPHSKSKKNLFW